MSLAPPPKGSNAVFAIYIKSLPLQTAHLREGVMCKAFILDAEYPESFPGCVPRFAARVRILPRDDSRRVRIEPFGLQVRLPLAPPEGSFDCKRLIPWMDEYLLLSLSYRRLTEKRASRSDAEAVEERGYMVKYNAIHHLAMATRDMDKTIRFWRDLLGMRLVVGLGKPGSRLYFLEVSGNALIAFFEWPDVEPVEEKDHGYPVKGPCVFDHVSFGVEGDEDLWDLRERLDAAGFWVSDMIDHGFIHSIYSFDPNGIPIEFSCNAEALNVRETPMMIDSHPSQAVLEGPEPQGGKWPSPQTPSLDRDIFPGEGKELLLGDKVNWWGGRRK